MQSALHLITPLFGAQNKSYPDLSCVRGKLKHHCCYPGSCPRFLSLHFGAALVPASIIHVKKKSTNIKVTLEQHTGNLHFSWLHYKLFVAKSIEYANAF